MQNEQQTQLDELLKNRANEQSNLPWLAMQVEEKLAARAQAKAWLKQQDSAVRRYGLASGRFRVNPRMLAAIVAGAGGALAAYLIGTLPQFSGYVAGYGALPAALLTGALAALATSWPALRGYYS